MDPRRTARIVFIAALLTAAGCVRQARPDERRVDRVERPEPGQSGLVGEGWASYYGAGLDGGRTASGERFHRNGFTAAHRTLRFGTCLLVHNVENGREVRVRVNDRGPYAHGRIVDVSEGAARELGMLHHGVARVRLYRCSGDPDRG